MPIQLPVRITRPDGNFSDDVIGVPFPPEEWLDADLVEAFQKMHYLIGGEEAKYHLETFGGELDVLSVETTTGSVKSTPLCLTKLLPESKGRWTGP